MTTYAKTDPTGFQESYEEDQQRRSSGDYSRWSPKQGGIGRPFRNLARIAPPHPNMLYNGKPNPFTIHKAHFNLGPNQDLGSPCLEFWSEDCPACIWNRECEMRGKSEADPGRAAQFKELAYRQRSQWRHSCTVQDMAKPEAGWQQYTMSTFTCKLVKAAFYDTSQPPRWRDITDPENGRNVIMDVSTKPGPDQWPQYDLVVAQEQPSPLFDMKLLEMVPDLTQEIYHATADEVRGVVYGNKIDRRGGRTAVAAGTPPPAQAALPAPPTRAAAPAAAPAPAAPVASAPTAPPPAPSTRGRRGGGPSPVPSSPAPAAPAASPAPAVAAAPAAAPSGRTAAPDVKQYAAARAVLASWVGADTKTGAPINGVSPKEITEDQIPQVVPKPPCWEKRDTDPNDGVCRSCVLLMPCLTDHSNLAK